MEQAYPADQAGGFPVNPPVDPQQAPNPNGAGPTAAPVSAAVHVPRLGKLLNKPSEYDGNDRNKCNTFVAQVKLYIGGNPEVFPNEGSKVLFAATYLRGRAFNWFEPFLARAQDPILSNFDLFIETLLIAFGDPELQKTMMRKLKALRQTTSAANYRTEFEGYVQYLNLGENALKEYFYDGLKDSIKDVIADIPAEFEPTGFDAFKSWCVRIDSRQHDRKMENKGGARIFAKAKEGLTRNAVAIRAPPRSSFTVRNDGPQPMELDAGLTRRFKPLTPAEKKRRFENNLCLYCGKDGHRAGDCPMKSSNNLNRSSATPRVRIQATMIPSGANATSRVARDDLSRMPRDSHMPRQSEN